MNCEAIEGADASVAALLLGRIGRIEEVPQPTFTRDWTDAFSFH